jgi:hypothetical protein
VGAAGVAIASTISTVWPGSNRWQGPIKLGRIMDWLIGVVVWLVLAGGLLALFSDDGRG